MRSDHHFPRYHVRPPRGYVNDPNGPVFVDGRWHLYFQHVYDTPRTGPVVWGHASSADLVSWELHRAAIGPEPGGIDTDGCWSGNTVLADVGIVAFYSGFRQGHPYQSVVSAVSTDGGRTFGPAVAVVADPEPDERIREFRDPFVWREGETWRMLVGAGDWSDRGSARLYESPDLREWTYRGPYASLPRTREGDVDTGEMWECPQLLAFGERDALLVSAYERTGGTTNVVAITGPPGEAGMTPHHLHRFDHGPNFYAASAVRESPAGPLVWGWITEGRDGAWAAEADWSGMLSLPRTVDLAPDGRLTSAPVDALTGARSAAVAPTRTAAGLVFDDLPAQFEVELRAVPGVRLELRCGDDEHLDLTVGTVGTVGTDGTITIDRDHASLDPRAHGGRFAFSEPVGDEGISLRWYVDGSVAELFTGGGRSSTVRFYPTTPPPWRLEVTGLDPSSPVELWELARPE